MVRALASAEIGGAASRVARLLEPNESLTTTLAAAFEAAHKRLLLEYQSEYAFKNHIVSKIVLGRHSPATASAILEQPMGSSIADVFIVNGTSTVYEIKTDLDSFARLPTQIEDYRRRAEYVYVVVSERKTEAAERHVPQNIGILSLRRRGSFSTVRQASSNLTGLQHHDLFQLLRTHEAVSLVKRKTGNTLSVATGYLRGTAYEYFQSLPIEQAHAATVRELKGRGLSARRLLARSDFPPSLRALAYATELSGVGAARLETRLARPLRDVLSAALR